jgi:hypothetical protein
LEKAVIPTKISNWTYEAVDALCSAGQSESDRHDFKVSLPDVGTVTKICCAFANTFGGFVVIGVEDRSGPFRIVGVDPDKELYGKFVDKLRADPDIAISLPGTIAIPNSSKLLYVFEIPQSPRRPHLPSLASERLFWKRQGSSCIQMTLEEIRNQMSVYEEKREKLALLLIDLYHIESSLNNQANQRDGYYDGDVFSFDIIDRVTVEAFAILKADFGIFRKLDTIKRRLMLLNAEKQKLFSIFALSYGEDFKRGSAIDYRENVKKILPEVSILVEQIERSLKGQFGIVNPYRQ